ncbi:G-patch domain and KOW motifs-containing protein [Harmonia axyridis]|uniref:G-patch domain and KOW motifs-containing protein n=1 Tax=Harmonia axyridis TaxID=115357 RepID=UPI001E2784E0|nr:G-patch domain and KOW motifs-containing protein [Harmonia axyridis]
MNSDKKISFGFSKLSKKTNVLFNPPKKNESVELIDCLEGAEIKVKNAIEKVEESPLIIPIRGNANNIVSQIERASQKSKKIKTEKSDEDLRPDSELTIEELAARQLLREARNKLAQDKDTTKVHSLPLDVTETIQEGVEPSMEDYDNVPIEDFGLACLRGMGWKEGMFCGKNQTKSINKPPEPDLRPKGLGLGAQKIVEVETKDVFDKNGKKLVLAKGAYGKITAGSHIGKFCEVQFCDEWSGRVVVKISNDNEIVTINQLFIVPISKDDFVCGSKIINNAKYEQYKQIEENKGSSKDNNSITERKHSSGKKYASNDSQILKKEKILSEESPDNYKVKIEHDKSVEFVKMEKVCDDELERKNNEMRTTKDSSYPKESKKSHKEKRDKYSRRNKDKSLHYNRESSEEYVKKSKKKYRSSSSDSSEPYKRRENKRYERSRSRDRHEYYEKKKSQKKNRSASEDSSEKCDKNKSNSRNRSKVRSSSEECDNRLQYTKEKRRSEKEYSRYSDDDYKTKYTKKEKSKEEKYERKHKSKKNKKSRKDSSSDSDYEKEKLKKNDDILKFYAKHKSRY